MAPKYKTIIYAVCEDSRAPVEASKTYEEAENYIKQHSKDVQWYYHIKAIPLN